jgi:hypothetical protein
VVARLRQLDILLQTLSALVLSLGRQNPAVMQNVRAALEWQESTLLALFQAYCGNERPENAASALVPAVIQVVTLLDNLREIVGDDSNSVFAV